MNKYCLKCISNNQEPDCYKCHIISEFNKKSKKEFSRLLDFLLFGFIVIAVFSLTDYMLLKASPNTEFGLSFGFVGLCLCFAIYNLPIKKKKKVNG